MLDRNGKYTRPPNTVDQTNFYSIALHSAQERHTQNKEDNSQKLVNQQSAASKATSGGVGGFVGGAVASLIFHPLELIKTRCQADAGGNRIGIITHSKHIYRNDGLRGFWAGVTPNVLGNCLAWGLYLSGYNYAMTAIDNFYERQGRKTPFLVQSAATFMAGVSTLAVTNPLFVVKTRMCLQTSHLGTDVGKKGIAVKTKYTNPVQAIASIVREEGLGGLWRGYSMGIMGTFQASIQMVIYERLKSIARAYQGKDRHGDLDASLISAFTILSKTTAGAAMYPFQVIKTRLQDNRIGVTKHKTARDAIMHVFRTEGIMGFYHGLSMSILRSLPNAVFVFVIYEEIMKFWKRTTTS